MAGRYEPADACSRREGTTRRQPRVSLRYTLLLGLTFATAPVAGCVTLSEFCTPAKPPVGIPCQLATRWDNGLRQTFDTVNNGASLRGLSGRLYLFDSQCPGTVCCDGSVVVDLYDDRPLNAGAEPIHLEKWCFPKEALKMLERKDAFGWGYTLFLPWVQSYRPDITQVHMRVCFVRTDGTPLYTASSTINLGQPDGMLPPATVQARAAKMSMPGNTPAAISAQLAQASQQSNSASPGVLRLGGPAQTPPPVQTKAVAPTQVQTQPVVAPQPTEPSPDQMKPVVMPVRGKPVPLAAQTQTITQTAAQVPAQAPQPVSQASWIGQAKQ